jgi:myo-inositol-1(or 4)-monophosphatase
VDEPAGSAGRAPIDDLAAYGELLTLAMAIAREVGDRLREVRRAGKLEVTTKSTATDMVTDMDVWAEQHIVGRLLDARPADGVLGEEGSDVSGTSGVVWCIDPIDGTTDYLYGHTGYSVSIAALVEGEPVVGVVHDPALDQQFTAVRGFGAWRDHEPLRTSTLADLSLALVGTGFSYRAERRARQAALLTTVLPRVRDIRRMGGAALDLCSVGCGRLDAFYEHGLNAWDIAAGGLVAVEAGARLTDLAGEPTWTGDVVVAPPALHDALLDLLRSGGAHAT